MPRARSLCLVALALTAAAPAHRYTSPDGLVRLSYPAGLVPGHDFSGRTLITGGWRLMWGGGEPGPGTGVVSFTRLARPTGGNGQVTEALRIGLSRDPGVVAHCGTAGLNSGDGKRLPDRHLGGHRWTVYTNGDAGMSQSILATDWRTVVDGTCYAVDRFSYQVSAADPPPAGTPRQRDVAAQLDAVLASLVVGHRR